MTVTKDPLDYSKGRMNGQLLAQKYILPHAKKQKFDLVVDIHSNQGTKNGGSYEKTNFIFAPLNNYKSKVIANTLINKIPGLCYYFPSSQTSPEYCLNPLVKSGTKAIIYETYLYENSKTTDKFMKGLVLRVDKLKL